MQSPHEFRVPLWVASFCCVAPFVALILVAFAMVLGSSHAWLALASISGICLKTTHWVITLRK